MIFAQYEIEDYYLLQLRLAGTIEILKDVEYLLPCYLYRGKTYGEEQNITSPMVLSAKPVDAAGNPWSGSYVYSHGKLVLDLMDNLVLEATERLQKCRIYQMSENKTLRANVVFLIVRDKTHQAAFAKALETLGSDWGILTLFRKHFDK